MTMFSNLSIIAMVLLISMSSMLITSGTVFDVSPSSAPEPSSPSPRVSADGRRKPKPKDDFSPLAPSPPQTRAQKQHLEYLERCADRLSEKCGEEIFSFIFENNNAYSKHCCDKLVKLGKSCHDDMTEYSAELPQYKSNAVTYLARSNLVYTKCGFSLLAPSPKMMKAQQERMEYLETCADKLSEKCGEEVWSYVFENGKKFTKKCCAKVRTTGKACHDDMTKYSAELPQYKAKASGIFSRSNQLWKKCHAHPHPHPHPEV